MKRWIAWLFIFALCMLAGCSKQQDETQQKPAGPTAQISYAAYQYDGGYALSEGWIYEMTLTDEGQLKKLDELMNNMTFDVLDESFDGGRGYRLLLRDARGALTRDVLIMEKNQASMNGLLYRTGGAQPLIDWLKALKIDEQDVE